jgi:glycerophosphoryl diester phosphodiesterase
MSKNVIVILFLSILFIGCKPQKKEKNTMDSIVVSKVSEEAQKVIGYLKKNMIIAHRGSTYFTPEETEPAFRWARNIGADYLEFDVQLTKDSVLIAFHDKNLTRTTNVAKLFPDRATAEINEFTLKELRSLDAGSWFNIKNPDRARDKYKGLKILTLKDVIMIAEGHRILFKDGNPVKEITNDVWTGNYLYEKDPKDNGNRPGIYVETKNPKPNVEKILTKELTALGWNINTNPKTIKTQENKVTVANSNARLILQSFSLESLKELEKQLPNIPKCLLLWQPDMKDDIKGNYIKAINSAIDNNAEIIGSSIAGEPNNYEELTAPWMADLIHSSGLQIHPYTFDTEKQLATYKDRIDGVFTNRSDLALAFYNRKSEQSPEEILIDLGY